MLGDHNDATRGVTLQKGDVVQVMDTAKDDEWLCRKKDEPEKVYFVLLVRSLCSPLKE